MSTLNQFWNLAITKSTMLIAKLIEQVVGIAGSSFQMQCSWSKSSVSS